MMRLSLSPLPREFTGANLRNGEYGEYGEYG